jgi:3-oxoacyl-[acyl-carrier protein] reductase
MMETCDKLVLVSGSSRGLGLAIVIALLESGYCVASFSRTQTDSIDQLLGQYPERFYWQSLDAVDYAEVRNFVQEVHHRFGNIYGLVNNAAVASAGIITLMKSNDIEKLLQLNLSAVLHLTQYCVNKMLLQKSSCIINISSIIGDHGYSGLSVYSATKAGLNGATHSLARELGPKNIRVNAIAPGYLETDMSSSLSERQKDQIILRTPLGRLGRVSDITGMIEFLLSDKASFLTGQVLTIDGGINC